MVMGNEVSNILKWRINVPDGTLEILQPESELVHRIWLGLLGEFILKIWKFLEKTRNIAVDAPKKVLGNAVWAIMTAVGIGTFLAGSLGVGVHWPANHSGVEPIVLGISVLLLGELEPVLKTDFLPLQFYLLFCLWVLSCSLNTSLPLTHPSLNDSFSSYFSRFIPSVKARFDYGAMIFILTFSLVSVSGYCEDKVIDIAHQRLSAIAIGASLCILISMLFYLIWGGEELHNLIRRNLEKLADALDGCIAGYFTGSSDGDSCKKMEGYKFVLNSKAAEDSMAGFARWEPAHGRFNFRHPWNQYLKAPEHLKRYLSDVSNTLSSYASHVLKELAVAESLPNHLVAAPSSTSDGDATAEPIRKTATPSVMEILRLATLVPLLTETA
ncbi:aluminum-activated malate transporter 10-like [Populus alba x Populus x berolinensis]|uniref:Aluminum-activated malate transporter 10-like n=1 Tax=Populus alba x Populus x berolinensis TaxID=444605 RepID=A0AAD6PYL8_9ROSI|nr:aluminum-activated malate transporter 10-like [Populus alba x Populus x berolinensis]